ncbi:MAG: hypothetical protein IPK17_15800 [Chloroflexi bacterium]|uniref:hypothetical protein n=1 Tax=Candidatus Flexifilum breve TaxID=3140694 RepID=UPI003136AFB6|nr:hypothetical protein [Chloroflexota bacterium]
MKILSRKAVDPHSSFAPSTVALCRSATNCALVTSTLESRGRASPGMPATVSRKMVNISASQPAMLCEEVTLVPAG